nr:MAG: replication associated protein [Cressdnaviricota sp.]
MSKVRHYCMTFFTEPTKEPLEAIRYAIYGEEKCPNTGKLHWQSYVELHKPMRMAAIKKLYNDKTVHIELRAGTREQARDYCKKDNKYTEIGKWISGQGHRSDLESIVEQLTSGTKLSTIMMENPAVYCKYRNGLKDIAAEATKKKTTAFRKVEVTLLTGPTGCGKTRAAMEEASYKIDGADLKWWQDYDGDDVILIDEYDNNLPITALLTLLDGYTKRLDVKGTHTYANWTKVYITTNLKEHEIHSNAKPAHRAALFRRITEIKSFWGKTGDEEPQGNTGLGAFLEEDI